MPPMPRSAMPWIAMLAIVLALAFLGSRGIWVPDEGRYTVRMAHHLRSDAAAGDAAVDGSDRTLVAHPARRDA